MNLNSTLSLINFFKLLFPLLLGINISTTAQVITKESEIPTYKLPDLLTSTNGQAIATTVDWEQIRRAEILKLLEEEVYGIAPKVTINLPSNFTNSRDKFLNGKAQMKEITISLTHEGKSLDINVLLFLPTKVKENIPIIVGLNEHGNHTIYPEETFSLPKGWVPNNEVIGVAGNKASKLSRGAYIERWPILNIINRGYGIALLYCGDIDPDFDDGFQNGAHAFLPSQKGEMAWGSIAAWSWGIRQVIEFFRYMPTVNKEKVIVVGNGHLGTAALWAAAQDNRVGLVIAKNSGTGGATLSKRQFGATIKSTIKQSPNLFANQFRQYSGKEGELSFDQHFLLSLIAPRPMYLSSTFGATEADPKGMFEAATQATPAYLLYNRLAIEQKVYPSENKVNHDGYIAYHIRQGVPTFTIYDWNLYLDYADLFYK